MQKILMVFLLSLSSSLASAEPAALLVYKVWESGVEPYISRILVTPQYVRMDEGDADGDFTLLDRDKGVIYNVSHEDDSVLVMPAPAQLPAQKKALKLEEKVRMAPQAPLLQGRQPQHVDLLSDGQICSSLVTVEGLMPAAVAGLRDFKQVLARIQGASLAAIPIERQSGCDLASNVYAADRALRFGLPVEEQDAGRRQLLLDYDPEHPADAGLFQLPDNYRRKTLPSLPVFDTSDTLGSARVKASVALL